MKTFIKNIAEENERDNPHCYSKPIKHKKRLIDKIPFWILVILSIIFFVVAILQGWKTV